MSRPARTRVGVVGAGVAASRHVPRLLRRDDVLLAGIAESDPVRRRAAAKAYGAPTFDSAEVLFDYGALDAVFICLPPHAHGPVEDLAIASETAMFIEKPMAHELAAGEELAQRIDGRIPVAVGYQWRQLSFLPEVLERLAGRNPNLVVATWMCPSAAAPWWGDIATAGGQLIEQATHLVDLSIVLAGPIACVTGGAGSLARVGERSTGFHKASVALARFDSGAVGSFVATCVLAKPYRRSVEILADDLTVAVTDVDALVVDATGVIELRHEGPDLYEREQTAFLELVSQGHTDRPLAGYTEALNAHRAACAMESALVSPHTSVP